MTVFADGEVDRSPCGSGTCSRIATLAASGRLADGGQLVHHSIVGSTFLGRIAGRAVVEDGRDAARVGQVAVAALRDPAVAAAVEQLRPQTGEMARLASQDDMVGFIRLDTDFHTRFLALAGNAELVKIVRDLRNRSRLYGLRAVAKAGRLDQSVHEHAEMIDLALAGDRPGLEALVTRHIGHVRGLWASQPRS